MSTNTCKRIKIRYRGNLPNKVGSRGLLICIPEGIKTLGELKSLVVEYIGVGDVKDYDVNCDSNLLADSSSTSELCDGSLVTVRPVQKLLPQQLPSPVVPNPTTPVKGIKFRRDQRIHFRTKRCRNWELDQTCRYYNRCKFAHID
eukprot:TRINITY_DN10467_c3_g1_i1.p1 TRINITY_DN10467_c3_g1~~TRINITY_DN10467_c3_g1_i1.p1  ORF type:complete len:145 (+),score=15.35 TRINITY_DN10467_c3_g1_i1:53-487(+)